MGEVLIGVSAAAQFGMKSVEFTSPHSWTYFKQTEGMNQGQPVPRLHASRSVRDKYPSESLNYQHPRLKWWGVVKSDFRADTLAMVIPGQQTYAGTDGSYNQARFSSSTNHKTMRGGIAYSEHWKGDLSKPHSACTRPSAAE
jgi:hypothetical protein